MDRWMDGSMDRWIDGSMDRWRRPNHMRREDLIICVAFLVVQKLWGPLISDDFQVISIASRNRFRLASLFGAILKVLGGQNDTKF